LPVQKGVHVTKIAILIFVVAFTTAATLLTFFGYASYAYLIIIGLLGLNWLRLGLHGLKSGADDKDWSRKMFRFSLWVMLIFSIMIAIDDIINI
jgi:heme o synthase